MRQLIQTLRHAAEGVAAAMLFALFMVFMVQIAARYLFNVPMGWTVEVCLTLWLWIVFWGGAFCLRPADHIRFDVLYLSVNRPTQRIFGAISAVMIVAAFAVAFLPTVDYVTFYKIKRSNTLGIRLHYVFSIYLLFMMVVIVRYSGVVLNFLRGKEEVEGKISAYVDHDEGSVM